MKVISVTPAGRRRYLETLAKYLLRQRHIIDEHHWWLNTREPEDLAYIYRLADQHPDFFRVIAKPINPALPIGPSIWIYLRDYIDPQTIYMRFDDDICYMAPDAIENFVRYRQEHRRPFLVLGNIVNNAVCTHFRQQAGIVPTSWGNVAEDCMDRLGWESGHFARRLHHLFLDDIEAGRQERWKQTDFPIDGARRFSINAISWFGADLARIPERAIDHVDEEPFLTADVPARLGRPNEVCAGALFGHFAFYTQRDYLERTSPEIMDRYRAIAANPVAAVGRTHPVLSHVQWKAREAKWHVRNRRKQIKRFILDLAEKTKRKAA